MKIKIFYSPRIYKSYIPPLGLSLLTSFIKQNNFHIEQDDLNIKVQSSKSNINMDLFNNAGKVKKFLEGGDEDLEREGRKILEMTEWKGFDMYGFSVVDLDSLPALSSSLVLSKILKKETGAYTII